MQRTTKISDDEILGDVLAPEGSGAWCLGMKVEIQKLLDQTKTDFAHLEMCMASFCKLQGWKQLKNTDGYAFLDFTEFCLARRPFGLERQPGEIDQIIKEGKAKTAQEKAADPDVKPLADGPGAPEGNTNAQRLASDDSVPPLNNCVNNTIESSHGSTSADYLVRRLKRDAPDIAEALGRGEYPSARAAGIAAGIVRVKTPLEQLKHWWNKATANDRSAFIEWMPQE